MSISTKILGSDLFHVYMVGRLASQRDGWMDTARKERAAGKDCLLIKQSIQHARERNRLLVDRLNSISV